MTMNDVAMAETIRFNSTERSAGRTARWSSEDVLQHEVARRVLGMFRSTVGELSLTSGHVVFEVEGEEPTVIELSDIAWVEVASRSKNIVIEITTRSALVVRFAVSTPEWATRIKRNRDRAMKTEAAIQLQSSMVAGS
jgi:hypothetical protein